MAEPIKKPARLESSDALRGLDMLWIISGHAVVHSLAAVGIQVGMSTQLNNR